MTMRPADSRILVYAEAVQHRWAWPDATEVVIDGQPVNASTVVVEVLRALDGIIHFTDSAPATEREPPVGVEEAARLLASYHVRYEDPPYGRGWEGVLASPEHAYSAALSAARSQPTRDRIEAAYAVLRRELVRRSPHGGS